MPPRVWVLTAAVTVVGAQAMVPAVLIPDVAATLGATQAAAGATFSVYGLALAAASIVFGATLQRLRLRTKIVVGLMVLAAALTCIAAARDVVILGLGVVVAGAAAGLTLPAAYGIVPTLVRSQRSTAAPDAAVTRATGRVLLGWALALIIGVPVAGLVAPALTWHGSFVCLGATSVVVALAALSLPADDQTGTTEAAAPFLPALRAVGRDRRSVFLLASIATFMGAFYGVIAFFPSAARNELDAGNTLASGIALAFGVGYAAASFTQSLTIRYER